MFAQIFLPIVFFLIAAGAYFGLTDPLINGDGLFGDGASNIVELRQEKAALSQALDDAEALKERAAELEARIQAISPEDIARLDDFLPDSVDDLQLVVDINNIAQRSDLRLRDVELGQKTTSDVEATDPTAGTLPEVATVPVTFTVSGSYADLRSFLGDIARSLRILEVKALEFASVGEGATADSYTYKVTVETYWLK